MSRLGTAVLIGCFCLAIAGPVQSAPQPKPVTIVNHDPIPVIVQDGDNFHFYRNTNQTAGRITVSTVPQGKRLIVTDIDVNPMAGPASFKDEQGRFCLEGPNYATKVCFNIIYPVPVHVSYNTGIVFEPGEDVIAVVFLTPYSSFPFRQYDVTITGRLVSD